MIGIILAWAVICLSGGVSIGYLISGDWKHSLYWCAGAVLSTTVTMMR